MKIVFKIIKTNSGSDIYYQRLSIALKRYNIQSEIIYYNKIFQYFPILLRYFSKRTSGDIIHSNSEYGWSVKEKGKPLIITFHHSVFDKSYQSKTSIFQKLYHYLVIKRGIRKSIKSAESSIAVSKYTKSAIKDHFGYNVTDVIYNFVDVKEYLPKKIKRDDKLFRMLFIGNLTWRKGADLLPHIMKRLDNGYILRYTSGLRNKSPDNFSLSNMYSLGRLSQKSLLEELNQCDVVLFPSRLEGFGYIIIEAMACGKPVVCSDQSSLPELIQHGENGMICSNENVDDYINSIITLSKDKNLINKIKINNIRKVKKEFNADINIKSYIRLYEKFAH